MKWDFPKKIELIANIAILVVSIVLGTVLIKQNFLTSTSENNANSDTVNYLKYQNGKQINLDDVDWSKNGQTMLLVLSSSCQYCTESAPFYQKLEQEYDVKRIAVLPEDIIQAKQYLSRIGVNVNGIKEASLASLGVIGTPTILLVNESGVVTDSWVGILSPERETEVLNRLQALGIKK